MDTLSVEGCLGDQANECTNTNTLSSYHCGIKALPTNDTYMRIHKSYGNLYGGFNIRRQYFVCGYLLL